MYNDTHPLRVALICGGPSRERGISLNSARSSLDHLSDSAIDVLPIYVDMDRKFYRLSTDRMYSNTPSDFDFKLETIATAMEPEEAKAFLKTVDIVFPAIHGIFGEDGELQKLLEEWDIPFVGTGSIGCSHFPKSKLRQKMMECQHHVLPQLLVDIHQSSSKDDVFSFFQQNHLKEAVVKPNTSGSSIGVKKVSSPEEAWEHSSYIVNSGIDTRSVLEPVFQGREFTILVLENPQGDPVALMPSEIEVKGVFNYRAKYLPTTTKFVHVFPRFEEEMIQTIRTKAQGLFRELHLRDSARLDGWVLSSGEIVFTDLNPLAGLEQNSFLFRQTSLLGMSHGETLRYIISRALDRYKKDPAPSIPQRHNTRRPVYVIFGGDSSERHVSLMSGTNVWLKLRFSHNYQPYPFLLRKDGDLWELPYATTLNHTVEEVETHCRTFDAGKKRLSSVLEEICRQLQIAPQPHHETSTPKSMSMDAFVAKAKKEGAFIFMGLHGSVGENGVLQALFQKEGLQFNGSRSEASAVCMDKLLTGQVIDSFHNADVGSLKKTSLSPVELGNLSAEKAKEIWQQLGGQTLIIKPRYDGCSTGVVKLSCPEDLQRYGHLVAQKADHIPPQYFGDHGIIEMPEVCEDFLIESFLETDGLAVRNHQIQVEERQGWLEVTVGVLEKQGTYHAFHPSITIAEGNVLSLEEKFQGGTGVNITPPPAELLTSEQVTLIRNHIEFAAKALGIQNYARIDMFFNRRNNKTIIIEANTLPALTPSTVIYHQALAEETSMTPPMFLECVIALAESIPLHGEKMKVVA